MYRRAIFITISIIVCVGPTVAQLIVNKSIFNQIYSADFSVHASSETILNRLGSIDSLAKIMGFVNRGGISKRFARVGDAALFVPYYNNKNKEYGIVMLTFLNALSEMRFTYQSMNGDGFFQDLYKFFPSDNSAITISFVRRNAGSDVQSPEQIAVQARLIEEGLARLKVMVESN